MEIIRNVDELRAYAESEDEVDYILSDLSISRKKAVELLEEERLLVGEKTIRNYREKYSPRLNEDNVVSMTESAPQYSYTVQAVPGGETVPVELDFVDIPNGAVTYKEYLSHPSFGYYDIVGEVPSVNSLFQAPVMPKRSPRKDKDRRVIAFGDFQINKHDPKFLSKAIDLIEDQQPDIICLTGDESDNSAVGRWAKGLKEEFQSNLQGQIDETVDWLTDIREAAPNAKIHMAHSNHMNWITRAVETRIPGFDTLRALTPEVMYELDDLGIQYERQLVEFLPNYLLGHGHQWNLSSASHKTKGIEHVMRTGCSILAGHVHQATLQTVFIGYEGKGEQKVYANPGCMMDFEKAMESNGGYVGGTSPNWSKGIVVITREAGQNYTELVLGQNDGSFRYEGVVY